MHVVTTGKDAAVFDAADRIGRRAGRGRGRRALDDRNASPGVKFTDAELLGVPTIVRGRPRLADGVVEVRDRATGESTDVPLDDVVSHVAGVVRG